MTSHAQYRHAYYRFLSFDRCTVYIYIYALFPVEFSFLSHFSLIPGLRHPFGLSVHPAPINPSTCLSTSFCSLANISAKPEFNMWKSSRRYRRLIASRYCRFASETFACLVASTKERKREKERVERFIRN